MVDMARMQFSNKTYTYSDSLQRFTNLCLHAMQDDSKPDIITLITEYRKKSIRAQTLANKDGVTVGVHIPCQGLR